MLQYGALCHTWTSNSVWTYPVTHFRPLAVQYIDHYGVDICSVRVLQFVLHSNTRSNAYLDNQFKQFQWPFSRNSSTVDEKVNDLFHCSDKQYHHNHSSVLNRLINIIQDPPFASVFGGNDQMRVLTRLALFHFFFLHFKLPTYGNPSCRGIHLCE